MFSVLLATYNGGRTIGRMLAALEGVVGHRRQLEIVVVDNGSTDGTPDIVRSFEPRLPVRYLYCAKRGKNRALNHGLGAVRGDLVVLTDDDVLPLPDWLQAFETLAAEHPEVDVFGGRIVPEWPAPPPAWIVRHVPSNVVFSVHPDTVPEGCETPGTIWGGNMMVRAHVFQSGLRFDESMGPTRGSYAMGGETEFNARAAAAGYRLRFSNRPVVRHIIRERQFDRKWILRRARRYGRQLCNESSPGRSGEPLLFGMPRWRLRMLMRDYARSVAAGAWFGVDASLPLCWRVQQEIGYLKQFRRSAGRLP
jgi:glycosyltransferase involved in cell wall biosynthesis